jgi:hypothetical protein
MARVTHAYNDPVADDATSSWVMPSHWNASHVMLGYTYKGTRVLTSTASLTYTTPASVAALFIQFWGAGGGGAGASSSALSAACGGSGGGGGYGNIFVGAGSVTSAYDYKCGVAGAGGASGSNPGVAGGTTWVRDAGGVTWVAYGGNGGVAMTVGTSLASAAAGVGGSTSNASFAVTGQTGGKGLRFSGTISFADFGGSSALAPGEGGNGGPTTGATAMGYACGGGGAALASSGNAKGGDGGPGLIFVDEYY